MQILQRTNALFGSLVVSILLLCRSSLPSVSSLLSMPGDALVQLKFIASKGSELFTTADCKDLDRDCASMHTMGYCTLHADYMKKNCKATCGFCRPPTPECVALSETMDRSKAVNLVLVGSKFGEDKQRWKQKVEWIQHKFDAYPPLHADAIEQLNVYYVEPPVPGDYGEMCWYGCNGIDRLLCCDSTSFERHVTNKCGTGLKYQIVVVHNDEKYGGSGGRIAAISIASSAPLIAVHELGHSMFGLGDEYNSNSDGNFPNCDRTAGCPTWADMIGRFEGAACAPGKCYHDKYSAPAVSTIMHDLWSKFGPVNERITCCKYYLETESYPKYCKPFDSGSFDLKSYCETYVWKKKVLFSETGENVVTMAQGIHYTHVDKSVEWELKKTNEGDWRCVKLGRASAGMYPRDKVEGDLEPPRTGDRIVVEVLAEDGTGKLQKDPIATVLRKIVFNEFDAVEIPPRMIDEPDDEAGSKAAQERAVINVILKQEETCRVARPQTASYQTVFG